MKTNLSFPLSMIVIAMLASCSTMQTNDALTQAHSNYDSARANPQVTSLAAVELQAANDSLRKADTALSQGDSESSVNQLAYIAKQQISIAQATAERKTAELAVANASAKRDEVRLDARTAEADAAKQQVAIVQQTANQQATALAVANVNSERDQALISKQEAELKALNAKKTDRGLVITLGDVLFSSNRAQLTPPGMRSVKTLADFLNQYPQRKVLIEGHTDSTGSDSLNQALSERRADTVRSALIGMEISSDRIATQGYGKAFPVASNNTAAQRQLNRRVEIILSDDNGKITPR